MHFVTPHVPWRGGLDFSALKFGKKKGREGRKTRCPLGKGGGGWGGPPRQFSLGRLPPHPLLAHGHTKTRGVYNQRHPLGACGAPPPPPHHRRNQTASSEHRAQK